MSNSQTQHVENRIVDLQRQMRSLQASVDALRNRINELSRKLEEKS